MALKFPDLVRETSVTTGTGDLELAGAVFGYSTFASRLADGDMVPYAITIENHHETGIGTYVAATNKLQRTKVLQSTNSDALVAFPVGVKYVTASAVAGLFDNRSVVLSADYTVTPTDHNTTLMVDASGGLRTITLPAVGTVGPNFRVKVVKSDSGYTRVRIEASSLDIAGSLEQIDLTRPGQSLSLQATPSGWIVLSENRLDNFNRVQTIERFFSGPDISPDPHHNRCLELFGDMPGIFLSQTDDDTAQNFVIALDENVLRFFSRIAGVSNSYLNIDMANGNISLFGDIKPLNWWSSSPTFSSGTDYGYYLSHLGLGSFSRNNSIALQLRRRGSDGRIADFYRDTSFAGYISVTATTASLVSASDETIKIDEGVMPAEDAEAIIDDIVIRYFYWVAEDPETRTRDCGPFAQALYRLVPRAVFPGGWVRIDENGDEVPSDPEIPGSRYIPWMVDMPKLIPYIIRALQGTREKYTALAARVAEIESRLPA